MTVAILFYQSNCFFLKDVKSHQSHLTSETYLKMIVNKLDLLAIEGFLISENIIVHYAQAASINIFAC
jgi:hypothetical protein